MNLLKLTFRRLMLPLLAVVLAWSAVMYFSLRTTVYNDVDEALHSRMAELLDDPRLPVVDHSRDSLRSATDLYLEAVGPESAQAFRAHYPDGNARDTLLFDRVEQEDEPFRTLTFIKATEEGAYRVTLLASLVNTEELLTSVLLNVLLLIAIVVITVLVVERTLIRRLWAPFHEALERIRSYRADRKAPMHFSDTPVSEFRELQRSLQELMRVNTERYALQKEFTDNAAHELHTPIAVAHTKLEELMMLPGLTGEQAALLGPAVESLQRLVAVNKGLLLLARIDDRSAATEERIGIGRLVRSVLEEQASLIEFKALRVEVTGSTAPPWCMDADLAYVLVSNLLRNAMVHNVIDGWVRLTLSSEALMVENSGFPLHRPAQELLARFQRGSGSGTGLGLAIVQRIAERYGLSVAYTASEGLHRVVVRGR